VRAATTHRTTISTRTSRDLGNVIDMTAIQARGFAWASTARWGRGRLWAPIAERYHLDLTVVSDVVIRRSGSCGGWDGRIRMTRRRPMRCSG